MIRRLMIALALAGAPSLVHADPPKPAAAPVVNNVDVKASGEFSVAGKAMTDAQLTSWCKDLIAKDKATQIVVRADGKAPHASVVHVLDLAKSAGVTHLAIATAPQ